MIRRLIKKIIKKAIGPDHIPAEPPKPYKAPPPKAPPAKSEPETDLSNIECGAQELRERLEAGESIVIVDVREDHELESSGQIETAIHIPLRELPARWEELKDANEIVCYCAAGARSYNAAMLLREKGLFNATSMEGGMTQWRAIGAQTVKPQK